MENKIFENKERDVTLTFSDKEIKIEYISNKGEKKSTTVWRKHIKKNVQINNELWIIFTSFNKNKNNVFWQIQFLTENEKQLIEIVIYFLRWFDETIPSKEIKKNEWEDLDDKNKNNTKAINSQDKKTKN